MPQVTTEKLAQARTLMDAGRHEEARALLLRLLQRAPSDASANVCMCMVLSALGQAEQAIFYATRATTVAPEASEPWLALGLTQVRCAKIEDGLKSLRRAVAANPRHTESRLVLGETLRLQNRFVDAADVYREGTAVDPTPQIATNLALTLHSMGRAEEALAALEGMKREDRSQPGPASALAQVLNYVPEAGPERIFAGHRQIEASLRGVGFEPLPPLPRPRDPERRLRVGVLSAELCRHSVAYFLEPLLAGLDPAQFELFAYSASLASLSGDDATERFRAIMPNWRDVHTAQGPGLAAAIRADKIDILIETTAMSSIVRLVALFMRSAPIQVTCLGYPATTGLSAVDYRIVDSLTDPAGAEAYATESLTRLDPCFLCYRPPGDVPAARERDAAMPLTFGSFNTLMKLSEGLIRLWARVLERVPGSRLVLKSWALREPGVMAEVASRFEAAGCGPDRLVLAGAGGTRTQHLSQYQDIDVALDTFPYHGTTTTCEALLMGVPVVSLAGATHASRVGVSLLSAVGLNDLVMQDEESYVRCAAELVQDSQRLATLRRTLRGQMLASPLCDERAYAGRISAALRDMWRRACAAG